MSTIHVTGASGFIGGAIARALITAGHSVHALARSSDSESTVKALGAEPVHGDLSSLAPDALPASDAVVHCAAWVEPWGTREDFTRINVEGTERVLAAARAAGARRFVHMSTEAVLWYGQHLRDVDESHPYPESTPILYSETKARAEQRVVAASEPGVFETIVLRPRLVWGPGDETIAPTVKQMVEDGGFVWLDHGRAVTSSTHIDNLVYAVTLALERGQSGAIYFVTDGEDSEMRSFLTRLMQAHGVEMPERSLPSWLARPVAGAMEGVWRALGIRSEPPLTRHAVGLLSCDCTLRIDKARRDLGYAPVVSVEEGMRALAAS